MCMLFTSYFLLSVCCCCCLCVVEACDTKKNSLYVQTYWGIKLFLISDLFVFKAICLCVFVLKRKAESACVLNQKKNERK